MNYSEIQLRHLFKVYSGSTPESGKGFYWDGDIPWVTPEDLSQLNGSTLFDTRRKITEEGFENSGVKMAPINSIVLSKRAPIGLLALLGLEACCNQGCFLLTPQENIHTKYYYYYLLSIKQELQILGRGSTFMELSLDDIKSVKVKTPEFNRQKAIADYLDKEIERIDELVNSKQRQIQLLSEKRQALITQTVTKGLNPKAKMKDSGSDWLGQIPREWEYVSLKRIVESKITDGPHETPVFVNEGVPFVSAEGIKNGTIDFDYCRGFITKELDQEYAKKCKPKFNDILLVKSGSTTGKVAIVETKRDFNIWSPLALIRSNEKLIMPKFLYYSLLSLQFKNQVELFWSFGTQPNIGMNVIENLKIALPPLEEQRTIVRYVEENVSHLALLEDKSHKSIELLKERKSALITEAVTGQLNIR